MSQMDNAITAIKQLFDKSNRGEQMRELNGNKELFQAARAFYNAIVHFERSAPSKPLEANKSVRAAESIARHAKDGRKVDVPVTYKPKKKKVPRQKPVGVAKKSGTLDAAPAKDQKIKVGKKVAVTKEFDTHSRKVGNKCIKCGQAFSVYHVCQTTSRQPTYANIKPSKPIKQNTREKDETRRPRRTPFDEGVSGTPIGATKLAGATRQDGKRAGTIYAKRFNARLKKGRP